MLFERQGTFYSLFGLEARDRCFTRNVIEIIVCFSFIIRKNISCCLPCFKEFFFTSSLSCFKIWQEQVFNWGLPKYSYIYRDHNFWSNGGCVRGRSRVPVTPKPAWSDHLQSYRSIVRKIEISLFCGNWKRFNCVEIENLKTSTKLFPRIWKLRAARDVRLIDF